MVDTLNCPYDNSDLACGPRLDWIQYMLRDIGLRDEDIDKRVQQAVEKHIVEYLEAQPETGLTMGDLEMITHAFWDGYEKGLVDSGVLKKL